MTYENICAQGNTTNIFYSKLSAPVVDDGEHKEDVVEDGEADQQVVERALHRRRSKNLVIILNWKMK